MYKAKFRTAHSQREVVEDVAVIGTDNLEVGQLITLTPTDGTKPAYIAAAAGATEAAALSAATHIIAQSDMTMEYGHIAVEDGDYRYSPKVAVTAASISANSPVKKVALFRLSDKADVKPYTV